MTDYERGWSDCKNTILDLLHSFGPDFEPNFGFIPSDDLEKICFAIAAQEPEVTEHAARFKYAFIEQREE